MIKTFLYGFPVEDLKQKDSSKGNPWKKGEKGAKHKIKEKEKREGKPAKNEEDKEDKTHTDEGKKIEKKKKKKKKSKEETDIKNDGLKKPLSAYMLYTNHRRPALKKEHPCKILLNPNLK